MADSLNLMGDFNLDFNWLPVLARLVMAVVLGGLIGLERETHGRASGLRTHILVCIGAAMTSLTSVYVIRYCALDGDVFRISAQVVSGIGFIGAGAILVKKTSVITGLTTAAGMWVTAAIGIALGYGFYSGALVACLLLLVTVYCFRKLEKRIRRPGRIYVELGELTLVNETIERLKRMAGTDSSAYVLPPKSGLPEHLGISVRVHKDLDPGQVAKLAQELEKVVYAVVD
jgi:putative Mg2+ transporter-C (MgtC) family protein